MSDIGGMQSILVSGLSLAITFFNYRNFDNYLVSRLYRVRDEDAQTGKVSEKRKDDSNYDSLKDSKQLEPTRYCNWLHCLLGLLPSLCCCCQGKKCRRFCKCRKQRQIRALDKARVQMESEINIVEIVKMQRYLYSSIRMLLPRKKRN